MKRLSVPVLLLLALTYPLSAQERLPIFDVHLHARNADSQGPPPLAMCTPQVEMPAWDPATPYDSVYMSLLKDPSCDDPVWSPMTDEGVMTGTIEVMERLNMYGVLDDYDHARRRRWMQAAPDRFVPALYFDVVLAGVTPDSVRSLVRSGEIQVLGEVVNQYRGMGPDAPSMEPYWALAEELDLPVGIHIGTGPTGVHYLGSTGYRATLHSALALEPVLIRHPSLRVYVMHAGWPMIDDLLALLWAHPQVYVGVGIISYWLPDFESYLRRIVEAGFGNRVMFGSDQMVWPEAIPRAVARIEDMDFLTPTQKRNIFYNNAARFFRFTQEEIDRHHGR